MEMKNTPADSAATRDAGPGTTDLERLVAAGPPATGTGEVSVVAGHGIWTVSVAGTSLGDYLNEDSALDAAAQARGREEDAGAADPWQRAEAEVCP